MGCSPKDFAATVSLEELRTRPIEVLARLRAEQPVAWIPALGGWLITRRDLAIEVLRDAETYTVDDERFSTRRVLGDNMLANDGATHARHRGAFAPWFRPSPIAAATTPWLALRAAELVDSLGASGRVDAASGLAAPFAVNAIAHFFGLGGVESNEVLGWYRDLLGAFDAITAGGDVPASATHAYGRLDAVVRRTLDQVPDGMLRAVADAKTLSDDELVANVAVSMFGAIETSEGMTATALALLVEHPDVLAQARDDRDLLGAVVDESLRLDPAVNIIDRYTTRRTELAGVSLDAGAFVSVSLLAANRDPAVFDDPDRFDPSRPNTKAHLSFVQGPHTCLGLHLARAETMAMLNAVLDRFSDLRLATPVAVEGWVFRKPQAVLIDYRR